MPSTYTQNLGLEKPATGEQAGVWGITVNESYDELDTAIDGNLEIPLSANTYQLNTADGAPSEGRNKVILWGGTLTAAAAVNITPNTAKKLYIMTHNAGGGFNLAFSQGNGGTYTLQPGYSAIIFSDGAGGTARVAGAFDNPQFVNVLVTGSLAVNGSFSFTAPQTFSQPVTFAAQVNLNALTVATSLEVNPAGYGSNPYDLYYRSAAGTLAPLTIGAAGQVLQVSSGGGLAWSTLALAIGAAISGSIPNALYFSSAANTFVQDGNLNARAGVGIGLGVVPSHTLHLGYGLIPEIWLDTNSPGSAGIRQILWATNTAPRWNFHSPAENETGGNTGSNLYLLSYADAGNPVHGVMSFMRASGNVTVGGFGDFGARLGVVNDNPSQPVVLVRGAAGQNFLQVWQNSAGSQVASIDNTGNLIVAGGGFLSLTPVGRLDLHGTVTGHPLGTIHIGPESGTTSGLNGVRGSICMEAAQGGTDQIQPNSIRMYYRNGFFMIQFWWNGQDWWASIGLQGQWGVASWNISPTPPA